MSTIEFINAFYIKLGRGGKYEPDSIKTGKLRLGWSQQTIENINAGKWKLIERQLRKELQGKPPGVATRDLNGLKIITGSKPEDIWITFHEAKLWWTRLVGGPVKQDSMSKFRTTQPWCDKSVNGRLLVLNDLPGKLTQLQGFRGTVCRVQYTDLLKRTLNGILSPLATNIKKQRSDIAKNLAKAIKELHWKDFETLVDLVFRNAGLIRVSVLGQHAKAYDLELREPLTEERYIVQVKSQAKLADLLSTADNFSADDYRRVYFVVHSPAADLKDVPDIPDHVEIIRPQRLGELALDAGLIKWLEDKVS